MSYSISTDLALILQRMGCSSPGETIEVDATKLAEGLCERGFVVLYKWDGLRNPDLGDNGRHTVMISDGDLGDEYIRSEEIEFIDAVESAARQLRKFSGEFSDGASG